MRIKQKVNKHRPQVFCSYYNILKYQCAVGQSKSAVGSNLARWQAFLHPCYTGPWNMTIIPCRLRHTNSTKHWHLSTKLQDVTSNKTARSDFPNKKTASPSYMVMTTWRHSPQTRNLNLGLLCSQDFRSQLKSIQWATWLLLGQQTRLTRWDKDEMQTKHYMGNCMETRMKTQGREGGSEDTVSSGNSAGAETWPFWLICRNVYELYKFYFMSPRAYVPYCLHWEVPLTCGSRKVS